MASDKSRTRTTTSKSRPKDKAATVPSPRTVVNRHPENRRDNHQEPKGVRVLHLLTYLTAHQGHWITKTEIDREMNYGPHHFRRDKATLEAGYPGVDIEVNTRKTPHEVMLVRGEARPGDHLRLLEEQLSLLCRTSFLPNLEKVSDLGIAVKPFPALHMPAESLQDLIKAVTEGRPALLSYHGEEVRTLLYAMTIRDQRFYAFGACGPELRTRYFRIDRIDRLRIVGHANIPVAQERAEREFREQLNTHRAAVQDRLSRAHNLLADLTDFDPDWITVKARFYMERYKIDDFQGDFTVIDSHAAEKKLGESHDLELRFSSFLEAFRFFNEKIGRFTFLEESDFTRQYLEKVAGAMERATKVKVAPPARARRPKA